MGLVKRQQIGPCWVKVDFAAIVGDEIGEILGGNGLDPGQTIHAEVLQQVKRVRALAALPRRGAIVDESDTGIAIAGTNVVRYPQGARIGPAQETVVGRVAHAIGRLDGNVIGGGETELGDLDSMGRHERSTRRTVPCALTGFGHVDKGEAKPDPATHLSGIRDVAGTLGFGTIVIAIKRIAGACRVQLTSALIIAHSTVENRARIGKQPILLCDIDAAGKYGEAREKKDGFDDKNKSHGCVYEL